MKTVARDDDGHGDDAWPMDRQNAVELLRMEIMQRKQRLTPNAEDFLSINLRFGDWEMILACARAGVHLGQGKRGVRDTRGDQKRKAAVVAFACERKIELMTPPPKKPKKKGAAANKAKDQKMAAPMTTEEATWKAAEEASAFAHERYGINLSATTIKDRMGRRPR